MATYYNPKIITNNIEFSVDAANVKSWSGANPLGTAYGYVGGGAPNPKKSNIDRIDYDNDTATASPKGQLSYATDGVAATGNQSYGYWAGGNDPSYVSTTSRIDYSNDTATGVEKGPLTIAIAGLFSTGNLSYGYWAGGMTPGTKSIVSRLDYSSDSTAMAPKGPLSQLRYAGGATGTTSYGYFGGGGSPGSPGLYSIVDRIDYSSDTGTTPAKGPLTLEAHYKAATGNASYGYFGGVYTGSYPAKTTVDRIDYSSDTSTAVTKGPLSQARRQSSATGDSSYGYWSGGATPTKVSTVDRLDYSSDTTTAVAKGPLTAIRNNHASTGSRINGFPSSESFWKDMTGKGHDGTVDGATYQGGNIGVWNFDGTNDEITLSATTDIQAQAVDWTWESWFYIDSGASSYDYLFAYGPPHQIAWYNNQLNGWFNDTDSTSSYDVSLASGSNTVPTGQWTHGVISRIGSAWKMYINGVEKASATASFTVANSSTGPRIGSYDGSQYFLDGKIASMRIYKGRGFTASEVLNNFNATRARFGV